MAITALPIVASNTGTLTAVDDDEIVPINQVIPAHELPVYGTVGPDRKWVIDQIIRELDGGQFTNAGRMGDAILRDARIMGALEQRNAGLFGAPLELEPADDSAEAARVRDDIMGDWDKLFPRSTLEEIQQYGILQGIAIAEKMWDTSKKPWTFKIDVFHPQFYMWRWDTRSYHVITYDRGLVRVPERSTQWICHTPYGYKRAYLRGRLRALVDPYMMRGWDKNDWAHWCEVHGHPIIKAIIPQQADPKEAKEFVNAISNMGSNTVIKTRQDKDGNKFDVELVEAISKGWGGFEAMLQWCDREISQVLLGQSMSTDGVGGLGATEKPGESVRSDIKSADNEKLSETLYSQALREYCEANYGNADLAPYPCWQVEPAEDERDVAATDQSVAAALVGFKTAGAPINVREFLEARGYPLLTEQEEATKAAEAMQQTQDVASMMAPKPDPKKQPKDSPQQLSLLSDVETEAQRLKAIGDALVNFRRAGAPVDDMAILKANKIKTKRGKENG